MRTLPADFSCRQPCPGFSLCQRSSRLQSALPWQHPCRRISRVVDLALASICAIGAASGFLVLSILPWLLSVPLVLPADFSLGISIALAASLPADFSCLVR